MLVVHCMLILQQKRGCMCIKATKPIAIMKLPIDPLPLTSTLTLRRQVLGTDKCAQLK